MKSKLLLVAVTLGLFISASAQAQTAYGVTANGTLFRFDVDTPGTVATIGNLGIVPEAIDFRPGTGVLYAIDVGPTTTQLYTVSVLTAAVTPVGTGFPSQVVDGAGSYNLLNSSIGFDFNPRTLQPDGSVRIRVVASNGTNLRLNSDTGAVAGVDTPLAYAAGDANAGNSPFVDAVAYINSAQSTPAAAGTTSLFGMDSRNDDLVVFQGSPNTGVLETVGDFGVTIDALPVIGFDIFSDPLSMDDSIAGDFGFAVLERDATAGGAYLLYDVDLMTGEISMGALVGGGLSFDGGFAVIPEPSTTALALVGLGVLAWRVRTRRRQG